MLLTCELFDLSDTEDIAKDIALSVKKGLVITLNGNLGAGKTTLTRSILRSLGITGSIKSPTFTLVEPYEIDDLKIFHFDLYRFSDPEEWFEAGFDEYFEGDSICFIEWAEKAVTLIPHIDWQINIDLIDDKRILNINTFTALGESCLKNLIKSVDN
ncbi:MAG: tRNA (adenosine(37)-N6)-threonylcarbamoyltransferase complex ATPase subunit type 1 TsaE [Burkholderiales bacterium]|nr:tRNA (adenosine(37)-N6)-threonylcarbamoyltransferase complex ATPase subunit type 1 TsaE [Burkholderiales bacterium]